MSLDILICNPAARFGQPEITLGILPGAGGTQRLPALIGKARAMDMVLTGRQIDGKTAEAWGLVSRCVGEGENVVDEAVKIAETIAGFGSIAVQASKEAVNACELFCCIVVRYNSGERSSREESRSTWQGGRERVVAGCTARQQSDSRRLRLSPKELDQQIYQVC